MVIAALKVKILPDSPEANLEEIMNKSKEISERFGCKSFKSEEEDIGFGLKALIITLAWPEEQQQELLEEELRKIEHVDSAEVIDFRRAIG